MNTTFNTRWRCLLMVLITFFGFFSYASHAVEKRYQYDNNDNLVQTDTINGGTIQYEYDSLDRIRKIVPSIGDPLSYNYDGNSRLSSVADGFGQTLYSRDRLGLVTQKIRRGSIEYTYNRLRQLVSLKTPSGKQSFFNYTPSGQLSWVKHDTGYDAYRYHNVNGLLLSHYRLNLSGRTIRQTEYRYNSSLQLGLVQQLERRNGRAVTTEIHGYLHDNNGNITTRESITGVNREVVNFNYDELNRLTEIRVKGGSQNGRVETFLYDDNGNLLSHSQPGLQKEYTYNSADQLISLTETNGSGVGVVSEFTYDAEGHLAQRKRGNEIAKYAYNTLGQLALWEQGNDRVEYGYDGEGNRVYRNHNGSVTHYVVDTLTGPYSRVLEEYSESGLTRQYQYGLWLHGQQDGQGNVYHVDVDRPNGNVVRLENSVTHGYTHYRYDTFGQPIRQGHPVANSRLYNGEEWDETTGLLYLRARYYQPDIARFVAKDSFEGFLTRPASQNRYSYAENNPVTYNDPSGMCV
ncbi:MAG: RHS repeat-associated core domain-containing protein, partial [Alteromonas sp.]|nr:RHS repeat-associated core domain-containing protein [Alteromonas sp.]